MNQKALEKMFWVLNPQLEIDFRKLVWREDDRLEWLCPHGIGHTIFTKDNNWLHGCDGCCGEVKWLKHD